MLQFLRKKHYPPTSCGFMILVIEQSTRNPFHVSNELPREMQAYVRLVRRRFRITTPLENKENLKCPSSTNILKSPSLN